jgi:hypothetical protein
MSDDGASTAAGGTPGQAGEILMLRTPPVRLGVFFLIPVVIAALFALGDAPLRGLFALVASLSLIGLAFRLRARVVLRPDRIFVINVRSWQLPWSQVTEVRVAPKGARGNPTVFVSSADGRRELLALRSVGDTERVTRQGALIEQWWRSACEPQPTPEPEQPAP